MGYFYVFFGELSIQVLRPFLNFFFLVLLVAELTNCCFKQPLAGIKETKMSQVSGIFGLSVDTVQKGTVFTIAG